MKCMLCSVTRSSLCFQVQVLHQRLEQHRAASVPEAPVMTPTGVDIALLFFQRLEQHNETRGALCLVP